MNLNNKQLFSTHNNQSIKTLSFHNLYKTYMHLHFTALKMASNLTTQGQEFVVCDLFQNPISSTIFS